MDSGGSATRQDVEEVARAQGVAEPAPALRLTGIGKSWGQLRVLDGVDLRVAPGETVWIGGQNGAGKTTLLRVAAGLIFPETGEIALHGLDPRRNRREFQRRLGYLSAGNTGLYARLTVHANLEFLAGIALIPRRRRGEAIKAALTRFGLDDLADRRVDRLSMGQRQRVRLAGSFLHRPSVVLLDEPETSLDADGLTALGNALADHSSAGGAAVVCSPSRERLSFEVDTAFVLEAGALRSP